MQGTNHAFSYQVCKSFQLACYFQRRRLKCKSLRTTSPMDAKWWQYLTWTFGSGDLTFRRTTRATFLEGLETSQAIVLDKQSNISLSIRSEDSHLRFLIASRRYNRLWLEEHFWQLVASQLVTAHTMLLVLQKLIMYLPIRGQEGILDLESIQRHHTLL